MPLPTPTFIPIRKKECLSVASWRSTSPEPNASKAEEIPFFVRVAVIPPVTAEAIMKAALRSLGNEPYHAFVVGPVQQIATRKKGQGDQPNGTEKGNSVSPQMNSVEASHPEEEEEELPEMALPPAIPNTTPMQVIRVARNQVAEDLKRDLLAALGPNTIVTLTASENDQRLPTLIVKGVPFNVSAEHFLAQLESLTHSPCHLRLARGDRGMFKSVMYIKYPSAVAAEIAKVELERIMNGAQPLKVEHKKRTRRLVMNDPTAEEASHAQLTDLVDELRVSKENEAFTFPRGVLSKEEQKFLKGLCAAHDLIFEAPDAVTVRRKVIPQEKPGVSPSPKPMTTPPWSIATPGSLAPKDTLNFRGIRSWKEARETTAGTGNYKLGQGLPFKRPLGPGDAPAFAAGRGRPVAA